MVLDGAVGVDDLRAREPTEEDYRGSRFANHHLRR